MQSFDTVYWASGLAYALIKYRCSSL